MAGNPKGLPANQSDYLFKPRRAPARKESALFLAGLAVVLAARAGRVARLVAERSDFSAENARIAEGLLGSTALTAGRDFFLTLLPRAAIFLGVCGSLGLRLGGITMTPVCSLKAGFLPTRYTISILPK